MADEEGENLTDILGFDPNENSSGNIDIPQGKEMQDLTPLQKAARASGRSEEELRQQFQKEHGYKQYLTVDADNLFSISQLVTRIERTYDRYQVSSLSGSVFGDSISTSVTTDENREPSTRYSGEHGDIESIHFHSKYTNLYKRISKDRHVNIDFDQVGRLTNVSFGIDGGDGNYGIRYDKEEKCLKKFMPKLKNHYGFELSNRLGTRVPSRHVIPPDVKFGIDEKGIVNIVLSKNGKETDNFSVPEQVDIEKLKADMYPDELLRNPTNPDINLDTGVMMTPLARIGGKWEVHERDKDDTR